jgi:prepilin-type processing-associated H-X9-DG protein
MSEHVFDVASGGAPTSAWAYRNTSMTGIDLGNSSYPINGWSGGFGTSASAYSASSFHPGGVNILMADGSARFLTQTADVTILAAMCTSANGRNEVLIGELP